MISPLALSNTQLMQRKNFQKAALPINQNTQNTGLTQNRQNAFPQTPNNDSFTNIISSLHSLINALTSYFGKNKSENPTESGMPKPSINDTKSANPPESSKSKAPSDDQKSANPPESSKSKAPSDDTKSKNPFESSKSKPSSDDTKSVNPPESSKSKSSNDAPKSANPPERKKTKPSSSDPKNKNPFESSKSKPSSDAPKSANPPENKKTKPSGREVIKPLPASGKYTQQELIEATGGNKKIIAVLNKMAQDPRGARALRGALDRKTTFTHENIPGGAIGVTGATVDDSAPPYIKMEVLNVEVAAHEIGHAIKFGTHDQIYEFGREIARSVGE